MFMKSLKKNLITFFVTFAIFIQLFCPYVSSMQFEKPGDTYSITSNFLQNSLYESGGNIYSSCAWPSLSAAKAYYGYDFTYSKCNLHFNGTLYNYYYTFSDNSRCYFRVAE